MNTKSEVKNATRDLMEYILLISFVSLASSFVMVSEIRTTQELRKSADTVRIRQVLGIPARHVILGLSTKRHIK
jgi:hypothetical protein